MNDETASDASNSDNVVDDALAAAGQRGIFEKCQSATFHLDGAIYTIVREQNICTLPFGLRRSFERRRGHSEYMIVRNVCANRISLECFARSLAANAEAFFKTDFPSVISTCLNWKNTRPCSIFRGSVSS
ncbi:unnamed protein product [Trichogramma brassicae]|uniref:Uncharacterized protein n=1 Tax=Trichogramma brassicae TaxID=86971 RepID=A0A6H5I7E4_9HYME|nr:unnamed protein product [Trichogramma brassicae]